MDLFFSSFFFVFGLLIGSFLNVVILRLPLKKNLTTERSRCPSCGNQLFWYHNVPVLSFCLLRGKCAFCGARISWRYPLIEILTGLFALWLMPTHLSSESIGYFFFYFAISCLFLCHFFIDLDHHLLLDSLNLYLLALVLPFSVFNFPWEHWLIGGVMGFGGPLFVTWIFYKLRGLVGLGGGDIKLFGILGILFGPVGVMLNIFLSCMVGAVCGLLLIAVGKTTKDRPMAFGPFILIVATIQIFFPNLAHQIRAFLF